jgi:YidC/Oxa1 family membrane protein insertase
VGGREQAGRIGARPQGEEDLMQEPDSKNLVLAMVLCLVIILAFNLLAPPPKVTPPPQTTQQSAAQQSATGPSGAAPALASSSEPKLTRAEGVAASPRVAIETPSLQGSINLKGARLDDLTLLHYHESVDPASPPIMLLSPSGTPDAYFSQQGWQSDNPGVKLPDDQTLWTAGGDKLTPSTPVTLSWDNGQGLVFTRTISVDDKYMFNVTERVANGGSEPVHLAPYALLSRASIPKTASTSSWSYSYEGGIGIFGGVETDVMYKEAAKDEHRELTGGWLGFSDKYWLTAVAPADQATAIKAGFASAENGQKPVYQADFRGPENSLAPGATLSAVTLVFAGPKEVQLLNDYGASLGLPHFDDAVAWGTFWFFTKPIFFLLEKLYHFTGNFGVAILLLTVVMRGVFFPLQTRAVLNMNKMKALQPEMLKLREKFADDKMRLNQEMMALQKRAGANPIAGCLPILLQIPVFFALYKVLYISLEMRQAPFFGWIHDLSAPDPTTMFNLFGLLPFTPPALLPAIGVWPLIYCVTMVLQQRMQPMQVDPVQARMFQLMPFIFTYMMATLPAGLIMYWSWSSVLTIAQQWLITRRTRPSVPAPAERFPAE